MPVRREARTSGSCRPIAADLIGTRSAPASPSREHGCYAPASQPPFGRALRSVLCAAAPRFFATPAAPDRQWLLRTLVRSTRAPGP